MAANISVAADAPPTLLIEKSLYSVLFYCFSVMFAGYGVSRFGFVGVAEQGGFRFILLYFLTPAMMVKCLLELRLDKVNLTFMACLFAAKCFVFAAVVCSTLAISANMAKAGLYGVFVTQSNDLALGYPIVSALYRRTHPEYTNYLYLVIPISLLAINPISFVLIELHRQLDRNKPRGAASLAAAVLLGLAKNPLLSATVVGLFGNVVDRYVKLPDMLVATVDGFASAYITVALFTLGASFGPPKRSRSSTPSREYHHITPVLLVLTKCLLLPLLIRELTLIARAGDSALETRSLAVFGFIYGCLPSAPTVFVYAAYVDVAVVQVTEALVLGTFLAVPWIFFTIQMILAQHLSQADFEALLTNSEAVVGAASFLLTSFCLLGTSFKARGNRLADQFIFVLSIIIILFGSGQLLGLHERRATNEDEIMSAGELLRTIKHLSTLFLRWALWLWLSLAAVGVLLSRSSSTIRRRAKSPFYGSIRLISILFTGALAALIGLLVGGEISLRLQQWLEVALLAGCLLTTACCLIRQEQSRRINGRSTQTSLPPNSGTCEMEELVPSDPAQNPPTKDSNNEEVDPFSDAVHTTTNEHHEQQQHDFSRHISLLAVGCVTMLLRGSILLTRLLAGQEELRSTIFQQLEMLELVLTNGQGLLIWLLFGGSIPADRVAASVDSALRRCWYGSSKLVLPAAEELDETSARVCRQFRLHHLKRCSDQLTMTNRHSRWDGRFSASKTSFAGSTLICWLVDEGICCDKATALKYGRRTVLGGLLEHVRQEQQLYDSNSIFYRFSNLDRIPAEVEADDDNVEAS